MKEVVSIATSGVFRVGLIRVLTTDDQRLLNLHGDILERMYPQLRVTSRCIPGHPEGVRAEWASWG